MPSEQSGSIAFPIPVPRGPPPQVQAWPQAVETTRFPPRDATAPSQRGGWLTLRCMPNRIVAFEVEGEAVLDDVQLMAEGDIVVALAAVRPRDGAKPDAAGD